MACKIRSLFWTQGLTHFQRILLATFVLVNGLNPEQFLDWVRLMNLCKDDHGYKHLEYLFTALPEKNYQGLYAYNITTNRYEYVNGHPRYYVHASLRKW